MKTIAITMDEDTLQLLDALAAKGVPRRNRSALVREAVRAFVDRRMREADDAREAAIFRKHGEAVNREARALLDDQSEPLA